MRGFGDMGKRARDSMIRDRFIAAQRSCGLRQHLDGVSSDTPIWDIVDRCRVWESHSEQEPSSGVGLDQDSLGGSGDSQELGCLRADSQEIMVCPGMDSRVPVPVVGVGGPLKVQVSSIRGVFTAAHACTGHICEFHLAYFPPPQ